MTEVVEAPSGSVTPQTPKGKGTIAIDMDDVLSQTNETIVGMHNDIFHTEPPLTLEDFKNYLYWKNRGWGTPSETVAMVIRLYNEGLYMRSPPVPGAKEGLLTLKRMGYNLIIITARSEAQREWTEDWIALHVPDIFDEIHFTGAFSHLAPTKEEIQGHVAKKAVLSKRKRSKAEIVHSTSSLFLIDDSAENAVDAALASPPVHVLLFGLYPWNQVLPRRSLSDEEKGVTYVDLVSKGLLAEEEEKRRKEVEEGWLPDGVERVRDWRGVISWVEELERRRGVVSIAEIDRGVE